MTDKEKIKKLLQGLSEIRKVANGVDVYYRKVKDEPLAVLGTIRSRIVTICDLISSEIGGE